MFLGTSVLGGGAASTSRTVWFTEFPTDSLHNEDRTRLLLGLLPYPDPNRPDDRPLYTYHRELSHHPADKLHSNLDVPTEKSQSLAIDHYYVH